jgi:hypothetical protein
MTDNSSLLSHISNTCSPSCVTIANDTKTPVQGKGIVTTTDLTFFDVLFLPQFSFNLLSVHKLSLALNCSLLLSPILQFSPIYSPFHNFSISVALPVLGTPRQLISNIWFPSYLLF